MVYNGRDLEECKQIGLDGELYLVEYLERELQGTGLKVHHAAGENVFAPFDIEIHDGSRVLVGIENKDITGKPQGVWQKRTALVRKRAYAKLKRIRKVMTTVTDRDRDLIGYDEGLVSQRITDFDFLRKDLLEEILSARGGS